MKTSTRGAVFATKMERSDVLDVMVISTAIIAGEKAMEMDQGKNEGTEQYCTTQKDHLLLLPEC
jgi:hypothetical protein